MGIPIISDFQISFPAIYIHFLPEKTFIYEDN